MSAPAFRVDGVPATREAFYAVACDPARSCVVEACAGAGKTWMLVSRILRALLDGAAAARDPRHHLHPQGGRRDARSGSTSGSPTTPAPRSTHAERVEALRAARRRAARGPRRSRPSSRTLHGRVLAAGRPVEIRTFHAWFAQLLRVAPLALLDRLGLRARHGADRGPRATIAPALMRAFHAAVLRDPDLRADYAAMTARARPPRSCASGSTRPGGSGSSSSWPTRPACSPKASRPRPTLWPEVARFAHPVEAVLDVFWQARLRHVAEVLGRGARTPAGRGAKARRRARARRRRGAVRRRLARAVHHEDEPRTLAQGDRRPRRHAADRSRCCGQQVDQQDARDRAPRMVRLGRALLAAFADYKRARGLADMADLERCALALLRDDELVRLGAGAARRARPPSADRRVPGHQPAAVARAARLALGLCRRRRRRQRTEPAGRLHRRRSEAEHLSLPRRRAARLRRGDALRPRGPGGQRAGLRPHAAQRARR